MPVICATVLYLIFQNSNAHIIIIIFKVPEVPKKPVPEEKVPVPVPKKKEAPPVKGTPAHVYMLTKIFHLSPSFLLMLNVLE